MSLDEVVGDEATDFRVAWVLINLIYQLTGLITLLSGDQGTNLIRCRVYQVTRLINLMSR